MAKVLFVICVPARVDEDEADVVFDYDDTNVDTGVVKKKEFTDDVQCDDSSVDEKKPPDAVKKHDAKKDKEAGVKAEDVNLTVISETKEAGKDEDKGWDFEDGVKETANVQDGKKENNDSSKIKDKKEVIEEAKKTANEVKQKAVQSNKELKESNKQDVKAGNAKSEAGSSANARITSNTNKNKSDENYDSDVDVNADKPSDENENRNIKEKEVKHARSSPDDSKNNEEGNKHSGKVNNSGQVTEKVEKDGEDPDLVSFIEEEWTLIERVKAGLESLDIKTVQWSLSEDDIYVGMFIASDGQKCEEILNRLAVLEIGVVNGSSVNVFPASISVTSISKEEHAVKIRQMLENENKLAEKVSEFKKSIKSRLVVAQVVESVRTDAMFTFDYLMLIILASLVAVMGLIEASSVVLVASMLISPLMGPILAGVFGAVIKNLDLLMLGIKSELKGLGLCILVGFITGLVPAAIEVSGVAWRSTDNWPTIDMSSRGSLRSLIVGILIAVPSGAGVALSILGGNIGSLVGVAISASLLPPAVNAGLLWANAVIVAFAPPATKSFPNSLFPNDTNASSLAYDQLTRRSMVAENAPGNLYKSDLNCLPFLNNEYNPEYYCNMALESLVLGALSLFLTLLNIWCIILMGIIVLKIKEVAPSRITPDAEKDFFGKDLKIARESYETTKGQNSALLRKKFLEEYKDAKSKIGAQDLGDDNYELGQIVEDLERSPDMQEILSHMSRRTRPWKSERFVRRKSHFEAEADREDTRSYNTIHSSHLESFSRPRNQYSSMRQRTRRSSTSVVGSTISADTVSSPQEDRDKSHGLTHYTVHYSEAPHRPHWFRPRRESSKYLQALVMPQATRFQVAKVNEDGSHVAKPQDELYTLHEDETIA